MNHLEPEILGRFAGRLTTPEEESQVNAHLTECQECRDALDSYRTFSSSLDKEWLRRRLQEAFPEGLKCPEVEELSAYASGLVAEESRRMAVAAHIKECADCSGVIREMETTARMLEAADPLAPVSPRREWMTVFRELFTFWPARLALAGAACGMLVLGLILGRMLSGPAGVTVALIPPKPPYEAARASALGIGAPVKPEAEGKFREAMAFHGSPDFSQRALPLLREAVALDPEYDQGQFWLGVALLLEGKYGEAIGPLETAVRLAPGSATYKQYLIWAYLKTGATEKALRLQTELLQPR